MAGDLEKGRRLERWAEIDLVNAFARPESLTVPPPAAPSGPWWKRLVEHPDRERTLEVALGAVIFVPLLVTWYGLWKAIRAYGELTREDPRQATRPFLQLWQSGFGGRLTGIARFEHVALTAVLIIFALVLLSVLHSLARAHGERADAEADAKVRAEHARLLGELASVLTSVQLELVPHRDTSPDRFTGVLSQAAKRLDAVIKQAKEQQRQLTAAVQLTGKAAEELGKATGQMKRAAQTLSDGVPQLTGAADRIEQAVRAAEAAAAQAGTDTAGAAHGIADTLRQASDTLRAALHDLAATQKALTDKSQSVVDATDRAAKALVDSGGSTDRAVTGMLAATDRWDAAAAHWQDAAARLDTSVRALLDRLSALDTTVNGAKVAGGAPQPARSGPVALGEDTETKQ
ncbi:hypothetical protein Acsp04_18750 [Actinomadura sp. NBRC 104425]|nr:hypothetical protein Acsp04_18750 [Actinomadura sp. NBRC 104425]